MTNIEKLVDDAGFVADACRYLENLLTESAMRRKYASLSEQDWQDLGDSELLLAAVELERLRRIRDGSAKREAAQAHIVDAPGILNSMMRDEDLNPRYRVDSIKALDMLAASGPQAAPADDGKFVITINLGSDLKLQVDKDRGVVSDNTKIIDHAPTQELGTEKDHEPW
jgi:hypothetical protein